MSLYRVLRGAVESLDVQVLFDPAKKQFHFPTCPVQLGDSQGGQEKIVLLDRETGFEKGVEGAAMLLSDAETTGIAVAPDSFDIKS